VNLRTIPPAASPITLRDLVNGLKGVGSGAARERLEREIRQYFGADFVLLVSSGKAAFFLILMGLKRLAGRRKVIIPAYTCFSVPSAVRRAGLEVVPCDVREDTLDFDFDRLGALLDDGTLCVVPTHLFGIPSDIDRVRELCRGKNIYVVEDAAQAMGAEHRGRKLGTAGDAAFFSLGRGKNITCGSGGIVLTSSPEIADALRDCISEVEDVPPFEYLLDILAAFSMALFLHPNLYWFPKCIPFLGLGETRYCPDFPVRKLTGFKAGLLRDWEGKLERFNRSRSVSADYYLDSLGPASELYYMRGYPYNRFPVLLRGPESKARVRSEGDRVGISPMYPTPVHRIPELAGTIDASRYDGAEAIAATLVTLPTHVLLKDGDRRRVVEMLRGGIKKVASAGSGRPQ